MSDLECDSEISSEEECMNESNQYQKEISWKFIGILASIIQSQNANIDELIDRIEDMLYLLHDQTTKIDCLGVTREELLNDPSVMTTKKYEGPFGGTITIEELDIIGISPDEILGVDKYID